MSLSTRVALAGACGLALAGASFADGPARGQDQEARIADLEAQVAQLKGDNWLTEERAEEVRSLVRDVLADADTRASLLQSGMTAGYDDGFMIGSTDGNFLLKINGQLQTRWNYNDHDANLITDVPAANALTQANLTALNAGDLANITAAIPGSAAFTAAQAMTLATLNQNIADIQNTFGGTQPVDVNELARANIALLSFYELAFAGFTTAEQDAVIVAAGIVDGMGVPVTTLAGAQTEWSRRATAFQMISGRNANSDESRSGFENTRTKLMFSGHVGSPQWKYHIEADFGNGGNNGGFFNLDDAYIQYDYGNGWSSRMGQYKSPFLREFNVHSSDQLAVERSLMAGIFSAGRQQGIQMSYAGDQWRHATSFSNGIAGGTNGVANQEDVEYALTSRFEFLLSGNWDQFDDFTSKIGSTQGIMLGVALHHENAEYGTGNPALFNNNELETFMVTADASFEGDGWNAYFAFGYRDLDADTVGVDVEQIGFVLQGGYYLSSDFELFARYEWADLDMDDLVVGVPGQLFAVDAYSFDDLSVMTVGFNKYFNDNVKWTTDFGYGFDRVENVVSAAPGNVNTGYYGDTGGDDGQIVFRTQLQLTF